MKIWLTVTEGAEHAVDSAKSVAAAGTSGRSVRARGTSAARSFCQEPNRR